MRVFVLTGAGVSAESGLGTFRDAGGIWARFDPMKLATPEAFARDPERGARLLQPAAAEPAGGDAERGACGAGAAGGRGGSSSSAPRTSTTCTSGPGRRTVHHMHGELLKARCGWCGRREDCREDLSVETICAGCWRHGAMRPDVVWFGEMPYGLDAIEAALEAAELFVAVGTSGAVYPAAGYVEMARALGIRTVELNLAPSDNARVFDEAELRAGERGGAGLRRAPAAGVSAGSLCDRLPGGCEGGARCRARAVRRLDGGRKLRALHGPLEPAAGGGVPGLARRAAGGGLDRRRLRHRGADGGGAGRSGAALGAGGRPFGGFRRACPVAHRRPRARFGRAEAQRLPVADAAADVVGSALVLNFLPDRRAALAEMQRVLRPDGLLGFYVWDYPGGGMEMIDVFWKAAAEIDAGAGALDEARRFDVLHPRPPGGALRRGGAARGGGRGDRGRDAFPGFEDFWQPFTLGAGPGARLLPLARTRARR